MCRLEVAVKHPTKIKPQAEIVLTKSQKKMHKTRENVQPPATSHSWMDTRERAVDGGRMKEETHDKAERRWTTPPSYYLDKADDLSASTRRTETTAVQ